jgi:hypothetical protein
MVFLPILPTGGDSRPYALSVGLSCLAAIVVIVVTGPSRLTRTADRHRTHAPGVGERSPCC